MERLHKRRLASKKYVTTNPKKRQQSVDAYHATHREEERTKNRNRYKNGSVTKPRWSGHVADPAIIEGWHRKSMLKLKYNLTPEEYDLMLTKQNGVCFICHQPETRKGAKYLAVDHNHITNKVRALLCHNCNRKLAIIESAWFEEALKYLEEFK